MTQHTHLNEMVDSTHGPHYGGAHFDRHGKAKPMKSNLNKMADSEAVQKARAAIAKAKETKP